MIDIFGAAPVLDPRTDLLPWLAILGAWLCFGTFAVPMKTKSVVNAQVDPIVFQCYKTFWTFVTSHLVLFLVPYRFSWWGILSGLSWVPAGVGAIVAVQNVGIACGQAIWQVTIILTSSVWGFLILQPHDKVHSWPVTIFALFCLALGSVGMTLSFRLRAQSGDADVSVTAAPQQQAPDPSAGSCARPLVGAGRCADTESSAEEQGGRSAATTEDAASGSALQTMSNLVPSHYSADKGINFVISFATGSLFVNVVLFGLYCVVRWFRWGLTPPSLHFRVMLVPGFLAGSLWSAGNVCSLYAVNALGEAIGYSLVQSSIVVSGLWGILFYREMKGWPLFCWALCCLVCLSGSALLALQKKPS